MNDFEPTLKSAIVDLKTVVNLLKQTTKEIKNLGTATGGMVKNVKGNNKLGTGSQGMLDNALGSFSGLGSNYRSVTNFLTPSLGKFAGAGAAAIGNAPKILGGLNDMMPDVGATINRASTYYGAIVGQGNQYGRASFSRSVRRGLGFDGVSGAGSDAAVAQMLSNQGVAFSSNRQSYFQGTLRGVGNLTRYMNMSNESATAALTGFSTGAGSSMLMRNFGVTTSDASGKQLTSGQIINQLTSRLTAGRGKFSKKQVLDSLNRGNLGASLQASGLSQDQQNLVVQSLLAQADGKSFDPSSNKSMKGALGGDGKNNNPTNAARKIYGAQTDAMSKAESSYISGQDAAANALQPLISVGGDLAKTFGGLNAAAKTFMGTMAGAAALQVAQGLGGVGLTGLLGKGLGGKSGQLLGKAAPMAGKLAGKVLPGIGAAVGGIQMIGEMSNAYNSGKKHHKLTSEDYWGAAGNGALTGASMGALLAPETMGLSILIGGGIGAAAGALGVGLANSAGSGVGGGNHGFGARSVGVGGPDNSQTGTSTKPFKLVRPVKSAVKVTAVYNQKYYQGQLIWPNGHNGIDYPVTVGNAVVAAADGVVAAVNNDQNGELGLHIFIKHPQSPGGNMHTLYAHLSNASVSVNDSVSSGQQIGLSGKSGTKITGAHLHFGLNRGMSTANAIDPAPYMDGVGGALSSQDSGTPPPASTGSNSGDSGATAAGSSGSTDTQAPPSASITGNAVSTGVSGVTGNAVKISDQINSSSGAFGSTSSGGGTGVGGGNSSAISGTASSGSSAVAAGLGYGSGSTSNKPSVVINLTIGQASELEAKKFAKKVKEFLEDDSRMSAIGRL